MVNLSVFVQVIRRLVVIEFFLFPPFIFLLLKKTEEIIDKNKNMHVGGIRLRIKKTIQDDKENREKILIIHQLIG